MASVNIGVTEPFTDCAAFLHDSKRLKEFAYSNGYLFFRGLLPSKEILELRNEILQVFARHGLLETGSSVDKGICNKGLYIDFENDRNPSVENKKI